MESSGPTCCAVLSLITPLAFSAPPGSARRLPRGVRRPDCYGLLTARILTTVDVRERCRHQLKASPSGARFVADGHPRARRDDVPPRDRPFAVDDDGCPALPQRSSCSGPGVAGRASTRPPRVRERETFFPENVVVTQHDRALPEQSPESVDEFRRKDEACPCSFQVDRIGLIAVRRAELDRSLTARCQRVRPCHKAAEVVRTSERAQRHRAERVAVE